MKKKNLRLIVMKNAEELGDKVNEHLVKKLNKLDDYRVKISETRFSNGEGKVKLNESVREKDVYILGDVGNYELTYKSRGVDHILGPDEHFADIKRVIGATQSHAKRISLVMPLLYESRQDKRKGRESLDCSMGLQEIKRLNVENFITFDAHNPSVQNAVPTMAFENFYSASAILYSIVSDLKSMENLIVIAPDAGAMDRARFYADMLGCDVGMFHKRRDYSKLIDGANPIVEHKYIGPELEGKNVIIVDDMIASGGSILDVAREANIRKANSVIMCATFALFTNGIEEIEKAYNNKQFTAIYSTNLSYVPKDIKEKPWFVEVDCAEMIARIIIQLNRGKSLEPIHNEKLELYKSLRKK